MEGDLGQANVRAGRPAAKVQAKINVAPTEAAGERRRGLRSSATVQNLFRRPPVPNLHKLLGMRLNYQNYSFQVIQGEIQQHGSDCLTRIVRFEDKIHCCVQESKSL